MWTFIPLLFLLPLFYVTTSKAKFISLNEFDPTYTYSLTLHSDPSKVLDTKHAQLKLATFGTGVGQSPEDVGSDEGRKFTLSLYETWLNGKKLQTSYFIYSIGGGGVGGWLHRDQRGIVSEDAQKWDTKDLHKYAEARWDPTGEAVTLSAKGVWMDNRGKITHKEEKAALFRLTKLLEYEY